MNDTAHPETIAAQALGHIDTASGGVVPALNPSTTFVRDKDNALVRPDNSYLRDDNDTVRLAEQVLAALEGAPAALLWPSGMAAIAAVVRQLRSGQHMVLQSGIYWGTTRFVRHYCQEHGIQLTEMDTADPSTIEALSHLSPDLVMIETPSNPWLKVTDIEAVRAAAPDAVFVVDSTAATPILTRPIALGADIVIHSATKALNGHSDVLAGVLLPREENAFWAKLCEERAVAGAVIGTFEAWLLVRSLRTLPLRVKQMCSNAQQFAEHASTHPKVQAVLYPGLSDHPQFSIAQQQMKGGAGYLLSMLVGETRQDALDVIAQLKVFKRATSLGGVESLVEHRHTIEPHTGIPENLLRFSIGIEHVDDLIADLDQALACLG